MVELNVLTDDLKDKDEEFYKKYNLVILIDQKYDIMNSVNQICRKNGIGLVFRIIFNLFL